MHYIQINCIKRKGCENMDINYRRGLHVIKSNNVSVIDTNCTEELIEDVVFDQMVSAFENRLLSRRLKHSTISQNLRMIKEFLEYTNKYPWEWSSEDFEDWSAYLYCIKKNSTGTQRHKQRIIYSFMEFLVGSPKIQDLCVIKFGKNLFNSAPLQI
jgi:ATP-dependent Lon protease